MNGIRVGLVTMALMGWVNGSTATPQVFDFKDPKGVNAIGISLDSLLEPIMGIATGVTGMVTFDPEKPEATKGELSVSAASIQMAHPVMTKVLHSADWIDVVRYPSITFAIRKVDAARKTDEAAWELTVTGDLTLKGVTRAQQVTLKATYLPGKYAERNRAGAGDLLVLRCTFTVDRRQFGIKPDLPPTSVGHEIQLNVGIVGGHAAGLQRDR